MRIGVEPAAPHLTVDNRLTAAIPLAEQVAFLVKNLDLKPFAVSPQSPRKHAPGTSRSGAP